MTKDLAISFSHSWNAIKVVHPSVVEECSSVKDWQVVVHSDSILCDVEIRSLFSLFKVYPSLSYYITSASSHSVELVIY